MEPAVLDLLEGAPSTASCDSDAAALIDWDLSRFRSAHAELLEDFYFNGKSVRDMARERSVSERAIEGRLRRAREKLKKKIGRVLPQATTRAQDAEGGSEHAHSAICCSRPSSKRAAIAKQRLARAMQQLRDVQQHVSAGMLNRAVDVL